MGFLMYAYTSVLFAHRLILSMQGYFIPDALNPEVHNDPYTFLNST